MEEPTKDALLALEKQSYFFIDVDSIASMDPSGFQVFGSAKVNLMICTWWLPLKDFSEAKPFERQQIPGVALGFS